MANASTKRGLFKWLAALGAVVLIAGIVMFLIASRQVNIAGYDTSVSATLSADGVTVTSSTPANPHAYISVSVPYTDGSDNTASCSAQADAQGTWTCDLDTAQPGATEIDATGTAPVLSLGLGVAAVVLICIGALLAIVGGIGMLLTGGQPLGLMSLLLIPVGVALDFALALVNNVLRLPLFLDSVGHILAGMLGGPVIGGITGWLGVMTNSSFQPAAVVWSFQGASIGVVVGLLAQAGMFKGPKRTVLSALIVIATSATLSSIISLVVYGGIDGYTISFLRVALTKIGWSMSSAVVATSVVIELIDKTISVGLPSLVIFGMSNRLLNLFVTGSKLRDMKTETVTSTATSDELANAAVDGYGSYDEKGEDDVATDK